MQPDAQRPHRRDAGGALAHDIHCASCSAGRSRYAELGRVAERTKATVLENR